MLTAQDIMTSNPLSVTPQTPLTEVAHLMLEHHYNGLPVVDEQGQLLGIICQSDLVTQQKKFSLPSFFMVLDGFIPLQSPKKVEDEIARMAAVQVGQLMSTKPTYVTPDTPLEKIASLMAEDKYYTLPVVANGRLVGVVGKEDVLKTLLRK